MISGTWGFVGVICCSVWPLRCLLFQVDMSWSRRAGRGICECLCQLLANYYEASCCKLCVRGLDCQPCTAALLPSCWRCRPLCSCALFWGTHGWSIGSRTAGLRTTEGYTSIGHLPVCPLPTVAIGRFPFAPLAFLSDLSFGGPPFFALRKAPPPLSPIGTRLLFPCRE